MAAPRVKRAFAGSASDPAQRHITSFFARDEDAAAPGERASRSPSHEISSPLLPPSVQANLLAVGMRVRKSVPEGYKTGKEADERTTPSHYRPQPKAPSSYASSYRTFLQSAGRPAAPPTPSQRELLPFCGLNKVGGLDVQSYGDEDGRPMFASSLFEEMDDGATAVASDSEPPALTSSQETVSSTSSYLSAPPQRASTQFAYSAKKRFLGDEEDEDVAEADYDTPTHTYSRIQVHEDMHKSSRAVPSASTASINSWLADGQISPRTQTPFYHLGRRVLAVPRRRQQQRSPSLSMPQAASESPKLAEGQLPPSGSNVRVFDQENVADFDEADFLDDMEMGGM
ncbi:ribonucleotide reductase inhibitor [Ophiostoma piceae UAMH 11346]|uniref:Ribonucleotide reductase inhibitor n=1 Tax=Ophiostoma piceae (strain UAMH 11346) TaxID=1262450 RepID=S3C3Z2_OPHP1|nr:ribonucleotide reductase inhibitor [Ophiostoma piceae UAMH 11346]